jgi:hypothetical protein
MINTIHRLATLFHEARHSDGRGRYATFPHIQCPRGHELQGYPACDDIANGAYAVGVAVDELLVANCHTCTANELANERDAIAHDQVRILKQVPATPETVAAIATGCSRVEAVIQSHNISRAQLRLLERDKRDCPIQLKHWSQPHSAVWADAEPEFLSIDR